MLFSGFSNWVPGYGSLMSFLEREDSFEQETCGCLQSACSPSFSEKTSIYKWLSQVCPGNSDIALCKAQLKMRRVQALRCRRHSAKDGESTASAALPYPEVVDVGEKQIRVSAESCFVHFPHSAALLVRS